MATIKVRIKKDQLLADGSHPIVLQVIMDRKKRIISLKHSCKPKHWNSSTNEANSKHPNSGYLNNLLRTKLAAAEKVLISLESEGKPFTIDDLVDAISGMKINKTFEQYGQELVDQQMKDGKIGNAKVYKAVLGVYKKFRDQKPTEFAAMDFKLIKAFESYLLQESVKTNSISNYMRTIRAIINRAIKEKVCPETSYPFKDYTVKSEPTSKRAISKEDIYKIRDIDLPADSNLPFMRDMFMFSFYNRGMNLVDIVNLKVKDIRDDRIFYTRQKTGQQFSLKLLLPAIEIINRYKTGVKPNDFVFPIILNKDNPYQDYLNFKNVINKRLKTIAKLAKVEPTLTTYVARHSWATIAKRSGIATAIISEGLGHETEQTTQIYLDSFENDVLDKANEFITG